MTPNEKTHLITFLNESVLTEVEGETANICRMKCKASIPLTYSQTEFC